MGCCCPLTWLPLRYLRERVNGEASNATPTPNCDTTDMYYLSALAADATFQIPAGTPTAGQHLIFRILDNGVAHALALVAGPGGYISRGATWPATTVAGKSLYLGFIYNEIATIWDCVAAAQEI